MLEKDADDQLDQSHEKCRNTTKSQGGKEHAIFLRVHPRRGHEGQEDEEIYSSTLSLISELDGSGW